MGGTSRGPYTKEDNGPEQYINPSGAPVNPSGAPQTMPNQRSTYVPNQPYTSPTYALTPQSGYTGLAQQLQQAFALQPQAFAAPRTSLLDMYASPWSKLYGGPASPTFAEYWGYPAGMGTAPPPGTPGYLGNANTNTPVPAPGTTTPPPGGTTPPPPGSPPTQVPGSTYPGAGGGAGPGGGTKVGGGAPAWFSQLVAMDPSMAGKWRQGMQAPAGLFEAMLPNTPDPGRDLGSIFYPGGYGKPKRGTGHNGSHGT